MGAVLLPLPRIPPAAGSRRALFLQADPHRGCLVLPNGRTLESTREVAESLTEALGIEMTLLSLDDPWPHFLALRLCEATAPLLFGQPVPLALPDAGVARTLALFLDGGTPGATLERVSAIPSEELGFAVTPEDSGVLVFPVQLVGGEAIPYPVGTPDAPGPVHPGNDATDEIARLLTCCRDPGLPRAIARWLEGSPVGCRLADGSELSATIRGPLYRHASVRPLTGFRREVVPCAQAFADSF